MPGAARYGAETPCVDAVLLELYVKMALAQPRAACGPTNDATTLIEDGRQIESFKLLDRLGLGLVERDRLGEGWRVSLTQDFWRKIAGPDASLADQNHGPANDVFQFPHIPGVVVSHKQFLGRGTHAKARFAIGSTEHAEKVVYQQRNIPFAFP